VTNKFLIFLRNDLVSYKTQYKYFILFDEQILHKNLIEESSL